MQKKILFLLGSANLSGGTYVILQHAKYLQERGHQVVIALVFMTIAEYAELRDSNQCWHPAIIELSFISITEAKQTHFDIAIFTWWATLFSFAKINAAAYVYFVQSIESRFYPEAYTFMRDLVNRTYQLGLPVITEAKWIQRFLTHTYQNEVVLVRNGLLKSLYTPQGDALAAKSGERLRILVEGPTDAAFKNVAKTIELCQRANVGEIWLLTSSKITSYPGCDRVFSQIPIQQVPSIYRSCDVLVKLSYVEGMFGPPLEMFHCEGTAIVYDVTGYDEYIVHDVNALVVKTDDENGVVDYLQELHADRNLLARLIEGAKETAREWIDWQQSSNEFAEALERLTTPPFSAAKLSSISSNIIKQLNEYIDVVIENPNLLPTKIMTYSLYHSGHYGLLIPINKGNNTIQILFGKRYGYFQILGLHVDGIQDAQTKVNFNLAARDLYDQGNNAFICQSEQGLLEIHLGVQPGAGDIDSRYHLRVEFAPVTLREKLSSLGEAQVFVS